VIWNVFSHTRTPSGPGFSRLWHRLTGRFPKWIYSHWQIQKKILAALPHRIPETDSRLLLYLISAIRRSGHSFLWANAFNFNIKFFSLVCCKNPYVQALTESISRVFFPYCFVCPITGS